MKKQSRIRKNRNIRIREYIKNIISISISLVKTIFELCFYIFKIVVKNIYKLSYRLNTIIGKLFMKLPRITRVVIIYILILTFVLDFIGIIYDKKNIYITKIVSSNLSLPNPPKATEIEEKKVSCSFDDISCKIYTKGLEIGMSEEQILISIAISKWETGDYSSKAFNELNNVGGMMCNSGLIKYDSLDSGINAFLNNLKKNYFDIGLNSIEKIQPKYCPIGAANDPSGLNKYWLGGVTKKLEELN